MVPREISTEEPMVKPFEVDYDLNPTILYKLIESKKWNGVISRNKQEPSEAGTWISRSGKDGKLRWKILPLHAAICLKAPKEVLLELLNAFPEGASSVDDQGMLPIHLALNNNKVDDTFLRALLNAYPRGIQRKDRKGRVPLEMKGKAIFDCWKVALDMERKKIRAEEKKMYESKLLSEKELLEKEIIKSKDGTQKFHLRRIKIVEKTTEYVNLKESIQAEKNEMNTQMATVKEQEAAIQVREKEIEEKSKIFDEVQGELIICKEMSHRLKYDATAKDKEIEAQLNFILDVKEDLKSQKIETMKYKDIFEVTKAQVEAHERKVKNLSVLNENYRKSLDEMTVVVNDSVLVMQRMAADPHRDGVVNSFFDQDSLNNNNCTSPISAS